MKATRGQPNHHGAALLTLCALLLSGLERSALDAHVHRPCDLVMGRRDAARQVVEQHGPLTDPRLR